MKDSDLEDSDLENVYETIDILDENNESISCFVIDYVEHKETIYILVVPEDDFDSKEPRAYILKKICEENEDTILENVEDEDEYNSILMLFEETDADYKLDF